MSTETVLSDLGLVLADVADLIAEKIEAAGKVQALEVHHGAKTLAEAIDRLADAVEKLGPLPTS